MQHTAANSQTSTPLSQNAHQTATSQEPGFGVEFEAACIEIQSQYTGITSEQTNKVKGEVLDNRQSNLWRLTGDDTPDIPGRLTAQYILDGLQIKLGRGTAAQAAEHVAVDLRSWHPFSGQPRLVMVDSMKKEEIAQLNPFYIRPITPSPNLDTILWSRQVTAPMPLRALNKLFEAAQRGKQSVLLPVGRELRERLVWMRPEFFQFEPEGISSQDLTEDQLWFLGLVSVVRKGVVLSRNRQGPQICPPRHVCPGSGKRYRCPMRRGNDWAVGYPLDVMNRWHGGCWALKQVVSLAAFLRLNILGTWGERSTQGNAHLSHATLSTPTKLHNLLLHMYTC